MICYRPQKYGVVVYLLPDAVALILAENTRIHLHSALADELSSMLSTRVLLCLNDLVSLSTSPCILNLFSNSLSASLRLKFESDRNFL
jgi:hypothetical protein